MPRQKNYAIRSKIIRTTYRMLIEEDYKDVTTRRIASACGLQRAQLHYYFNKKEDILYTIVMTMILDGYGAVEDLLPEDKFRWGLHYANMKVFYNQFFLNSVRENLYMSLVQDAPLYIRFIDEMMVYGRQRVDFVMSHREVAYIIQMMGGINGMVLSKDISLKDFKVWDLIDLSVESLYKNLGFTTEAYMGIRKEVDAILTDEVLKPLSDRLDWIFLESTEDIIL